MITWRTGKPLTVDDASEGGISLLRDHIVTRARAARHPLRGKIYCHALTFSRKPKIGPFHVVTFSTTLMK